MSAPTRPVLAAVTLLVVAALATACGSTPAGSGAPGSTGPASTQPAPVPSTGSPTPSGAIPPDVRDRAPVRAAIEDAAGRQAVAPDDVVIAEFTPVTWNDGSLGCPKKDMSYTQALVEGELLVLRVGAAQLSYHGRVDGPYTFCAEPSAGYSVGG